MVEDLQGAKTCMEVVMARNGKYTHRNQPDFSVVFGEYFG
jgi:hypothetical protein